MPLCRRSNQSVVASLLDREACSKCRISMDVSDPLACIEVFLAAVMNPTGQAAGPGTVEEQWAVGGVQAP